MKLKVWALVAVVLLSASMAASAAVVLTIHRLNDWQAVLTGSGALGPVGPEASSNGHMISLDDPFAWQPAAHANFSVLSSANSMFVGGVPIAFAQVAGSAFSAQLDTGRSFMYFGSWDGRGGIDFAPGAEMLGSLSLNLPRDSGATLALPGRSGDVYWGGVASFLGHNETPPILVGTWTVVPEPGSLPLVGLGLWLAVLAGKRRRGHRSPPGDWLAHERSR